MENSDTLEVIQRIPLDTVHKENYEELRDFEEREKSKGKEHGCE